MDFRLFLESIDKPACVFSVEKCENGEYGELRIVAGNQSYIDSIEQSKDGIKAYKSVFQPDSLYTDYLPRDLNLEHSCVQAAVKKQCVHSYTQPDSSSKHYWFHFTYFPLAEDENRWYCASLIEVTPKPDVSKMTGISSELAATVLEMSIKIDGTTDFKAAMNEVIKDLRSLCGAKRCCIILQDHHERTCSVLCEDLSPEAVRKPMSEIVDDDFYNLTETWEDTLAGSSSLIIRNEKELELVRERSPRWYEGLTENHVKSVILFSLKFQGARLGYIWATNFESENAEQIKNTLEVTSFILGSEIANYQLLNRLKVLSSTDLLTGVMNRNEMNNYVEALSSGEKAAGQSAGVVFADLNGLKYVNDRDGHPAGDELLRNAARALKDVFLEDEIFRAGGDEFTMIIIGATEAELKEKADALREAMTNYDKVSFAIGYALAEDAKDVRTALRISDENMYIDKEKYYQSNPEIMR